jgi:mono/diheme cytochrome c family protein
MVFTRLLPVLIAGSLLTACDQGADEQALRYDRRQVGTAQLELGRSVYLKHCAVCHGLKAEGAPDWRLRDKDGKYPPPPLNGTGHAWHHPQQVLLEIIQQGTGRLGGNMPAWGDKLSEAEIKAVIRWFQSHWPEQLYEAWVRTDKRSRETR